MDDGVSCVRRGHWLELQRITNLQEADDQAKFQGPLLKRGQINAGSAARAAGVLT
jgi:hypothetical protein